MLHVRGMFGVASIINFPFSAGLYQFFDMKMM